MRKPEHEELIRLLAAIDAKQMKFNRYDMRWSTESKVNWESFNLGLETARDQISNFIAELESQDESANPQVEQRKELLCSP